MEVPSVSFGAWVVSGIAGVGADTLAPVFCAGNTPAQEIPEGKLRGMRVAADTALTSVEFGCFCSLQIPYANRTGIMLQHGKERIKRIAQRFIAGTRGEKPRGVPEGRLKCQKEPCFNRPSGTGRDQWPPQPSDESLGYSHVPPPGQKVILHPNRPTFPETRGCVGRRPIARRA